MNGCWTQRDIWKRPPIRSIPKTKPSVCRLVAVAGVGARYVKCCAPTLCSFKLCDLMDDSLEICRLGFLGLHES